MLCWYTFAYLKYSINVCYDRYKSIPHSSFGRALGLQPEGCEFKY